MSNAKFKLGDRFRLMLNGDLGVIIGRMWTDRSYKVVLADDKYWPHNCYRRFDEAEMDNLSPLDELIESTRYIRL